MGNIFKDQMTQNIIKDRDVRLEIRLLYAFIGCECIWAIIMCINFSVLGLRTSAIAFAALAAFLIPFGLGLRFEKIRELLKSMYQLAVMVAVPVFWYLSGGTRSSASSLFLIEPLLFAMINRGFRQKLYIVLSLVSTSIVSMLSNRFPDRFPGIPMTDMQHNITSVSMGLTVTIWITFMIYYQKREYIYEYNRADQMTEELKRSNKMQKNFLANMSHEIRSPLGIVLGFNSLIKDTDDVAQIHEYSANIESAGKTLHTVINDILDYSKIEAGKLDIIEGNYDLKNVISDVYNAIKLRADEKGLEFVVEENSVMPRYLYGDNIRLRQCLLNLLTNAVKYTDNGRITLRMSDEASKADGLVSYRLVFEVIDTGRGISADVIPHLFTAFQRLDEGQNRGIEGTGLGLAITKSLLDEMGGEILVKSEVGKGSAFTIILNQKAGEEKSDIEDSALAFLNLSGIRVLVVDDTAVNLKLMDKILKKMSVAVTTVDSGAGALEICQTEHFDVILLDHMMPEMDGVETFKRMKVQDGANNDTPVIMLTANAMAGVEREYLELGFSDYISKPVDVKDLKKKIYSHAKKIK